jgi:hypothetical protein
MDVIDEYGDEVRQDNYGAVLVCGKNIYADN